MYIPRSFNVEDPTLLHELMHQFSFATLVTVADGVPVASHIPILHRPAADGFGVLRAHLARANPQWRSFEQGGEALAIFQGHHAYVSPGWYTTYPNVPTWNYMVVHAYGVPRIIEDYDQVLEFLRETVDRYEREYRHEQPWSLDAPGDYMQRMVKAIVAFDMPISRIEGKFKLSQNRSREDQTGVVAGLEHSADAMSRELAEEMRRLVLQAPAGEPVDRP